MNWTLQIIGLFPNLLWFLAQRPLRRKQARGWLIEIAAEFAWIAYFAYTQTWTTLPWCGVALWQFTKSYREWRSIKV